MTSPPNPNPPSDDSGPSPFASWRDAWATRTEAPTEINPLAYEPTNGAEAAAVANVLWKSGLVTAFDRGSNEKRPATFHEIMVLMMTARTMGLSVMQGISGLDLIEGRAVPRSRLLASLARARPDFVALRPLESTATKSRWLVHRQGEEPLEVEYTIEDAQRAGLTSKKNWQRYPRTMLNQRCQAEAVQLAFPEVGLGMPAAEEIIEDRDAERAPPPPDVVRQREEEIARGFTRGTSGPPRAELPPPTPTLTIKPIPEPERVSVAAARQRFLREAEDAGAASLAEIEDAAIEVADQPDIAHLTDAQAAAVIAHLKSKRVAQQLGTLKPDEDEPPPPSDADRPPAAETSWGPDPQRGGAWAPRKRRQ